MSNSEYIETTLRERVSELENDIEVLRVKLAAGDETFRSMTVLWENALKERDEEFYRGVEYFACWMLDHVEGETVTEELLREWATKAWLERGSAMEAATAPLVTVCDKCLQASCWQGIFMCQEAQSAGIVQKTREELAALNREHPSYWMNHGHPLYWKTESV